MKNKILMAIFVFWFVLLLGVAHAEIYSYGDVRVNYQKDTVTHYNYYQIQDTSISGIGKHKIVPIAIYSEIQDLPYDISNYYPQYTNAFVDWCNLTIYHYINTYDSTGGVSGTSVDTFNQYYTSEPNGTTDYHEYNLVDRDTLTSFVECHYTNNDTLFIDGVLFGRSTGFFPAMSCKGCEDKSFEELTRQNENLKASLDKSFSIYAYIQNIISYDYELWLIAGWLFKIVMIFVAIALFVKGIMIFYNKMKELEKRL
jgi:hypothetical protein